MPHWVPNQQDSLDSGRFPISFKGNLLIYLQIVAGLVSLVLGGEWLVRGATSMAKRFQISPLVIGLTVVAFGTSAPELGVSLVAAFQGKGGVAVGNVVGSNIINITLVLGAAALVAPLVVSRQIIRRDLPILMLASVATAGFALDGTVSRWEGAVMFVALVIYLFHGIRDSRRESKREKLAQAEASLELEVESEDGNGNILLDILWFVLGLTALGVGAHWLVSGATKVAEDAGISNLVIGLTVVAIGTSLPEVVTSVVAAVRGERDIAVGNVIGSNLFNLLCVLGLTAVMDPAGGVPIRPARAISFDFPVMLGITALCFPIFWTSGLIKRWEGAIFLLIYGCYNAELIAGATNSPYYNKICIIALVLVSACLVPIFISCWVAVRDSKKVDGHELATDDSV